VAPRGMLVFMPGLKIKARLARSRENASEIPAGRERPITSIKSRERRLLRNRTYTLCEFQAKGLKRAKRPRFDGMFEENLEALANVYLIIGREYVYIYIYIYMCVCVCVCVCVCHRRIQENAKRSSEAKLTSRGEFLPADLLLDHPPPLPAAPPLLSRREVLAGSARHSR